MARRTTDRSPPAHWGTVAAVLLVLASALTIDGFAHNSIGHSATASAGRDAGLDAGPVVDFAHRPVRSVAPPAARIALTFDDGPDPKWTPRVLRVLTRHHARATFFMVGAKVARHPALVRRVRRAGNEIGSHTFTHTNLSRVGRVRSAVELSLTQTALAGAVGINTSLLRLPYSSEPSSSTTGEVAAARRAAGYGYLVVFATNDPEDWRRPGAAVIANRSLPEGSAGAVIMLHDAGGNRAQTVTALDSILTVLSARGDRFVTVSELFGKARPAVNPPVGMLARLQGLAMLSVVFVAHVITRLLQFLLLPIGILSLLRALVVLAFARRHARASRHRERPDYAPPVTVVVPAYNEAVGIEASVRSLVAGDYPDLEVIVVDDGSTDGTADVVDALRLPGITVIRQANAGKAAALNRGIEESRRDVVVMLDGDTVFEPDTLRCLVAPLADPTVGAVSGNTKVGNRRGLLGKWQHTEYVYGFNLDRRMFDALQCMTTVPGAVGAFRREALVGVGGMSTDTLAEDTDITMALNRAGWGVVYEERARAWTEAPPTLGSLWRQRYRWSYGTLQAMWKHRGAIRERSRLGLVGIPYIVFFQVLLLLIAPAIDLVTLYGIAFLNPVPVVGYWVLFNLLNVLLGVYAFRLDHERLGPLWTVALQQFVYRQLMYLVVIQSARTALAVQRLHCHRIPLTGNVRVSSPAG